MPGSERLLSLVITLRLAHHQTHWSGVFGKCVRVTFSRNWWQTMALVRWNPLKCVTDWTIHRIYLLYLLFEIYRGFLFRFALFATRVAFEIYASQNNDISATFDCTYNTKQPTERTVANSFSLFFYVFIFFIFFCSQP